MRSTGRLVTLFEAMEIAEHDDYGDAVDLFAGPGGWSEACKALGLDDIGIEYDRWACSTRRAAGHRTVEADVSHLDPLEFAGRPGLIASPPCQAFSAAGKGHGRDFVEALADAIASRSWTARPHRDPRVWLVLEVGRWYEALRPEWIVLEQVPAVLPLWSAYAEILEADGYSTWTGKLDAMTFGVPQIRHRAVLIASREQTVGPPPPTHGKPPTDLLQWVTMAKALGWGMTGRPGMTLAVGTAAGGQDPAGVGGSAARAALYREREEGRWVLQTGQSTMKHGRTPDDVEVYERDLDRPAPTVTTMGRLWKVVPEALEEPLPPRYLHTGVDWRDDGSSQRIDGLEQPSPAVTTRSGRQWVATPDAVDRSTALRRAGWEHERPATTIAGDPRVFAPGSHIANDGRNLDHAVGRSDEAIRITIEDALVLQSFRRDYPVAGVKTKQFEQIGNAVPPRMAEAILRQFVKRS